MCLHSVDVFPFVVAACVESTVPPALSDVQLLKVSFTLLLIEKCVICNKDSCGVFRT